MISYYGVKLLTVEDPSLLLSRCRFHHYLCCNQIVKALPCNQYNLHPQLIILTNIDLDKEMVERGDGEDTSNILGEKYLVRRFISVFTFELNWRPEFCIQEQVGRNVSNGGGGDDQHTLYSDLHLLREKALRGPDLACSWHLVPPGVMTNQCIDVDLMCKLR